MIRITYPKNLSELGFTDKWEETIINYISEGGTLFLVHYDTTSDNRELAKLTPELLTNSCLEKGKLSLFLNRIDSGSSHGICRITCNKPTTLLPLTKEVQQKLFQSAHSMLSCLVNETETAKSVSIFDVTLRMKNSMQEEQKT